MTCKITLQIGNISAAVECSCKEDAAALLRLLAGFDDRKVTPTAAAPWYPDDSGKWVGVPDDLMRMPPELDYTDRVCVLFREERVTRKDLGRVVKPAHEWLCALDRAHGGRIVAYKKVKP